MHDDPTVPVRRLLVAVAAVFGVLVALALAQFAVQAFYADRVASYATAVLDQASAVSRASIASLRSERRVSGALCSDEDLAELRHARFQSEYLYDLGRVQDGRIVCTAEWGRIPNAVALPPPHRREPNGDELWRDVPHPMDGRVSVDMARNGAVIVFTGPRVFKVFETPPDGYSSLLLTRDGQYVFRRFGDTSWLDGVFESPPPGHGVLSSRLTRVACAEGLDLCVVAAVSHVNILQQPIPTWIGIAGIGALAGGSFAQMLVMRRMMKSSLPQQVRRAVASGRLHPVYQPLVSIRDRRMVGAEALARLTDDEGMPIAPDVFIPIAEEIGLIGSITHIVIHEALTEMRPRLTDASGFYLSINLTAADVADPGLRDYLDAETARIGVARERVVLEITERSTAEHGRLLEGITRLRASGYRFFIDDFGTGYSSLAYLAELPIDGIKIDRMFTMAIGKEAVSSTIVEKICSIADELGVRLVVEGVEEQQQADHILRLHPGAIGQGWLFGRPMAAGALMSWSASRRA